jgi:hypothetical protein
VGRPPARNFGGRRLYLSWYPACRLGATGDLVPPDWGAVITAELRRQVFDATLTALGVIVPTIGALGVSFDDTQVEGGLIFNWGRTDISDPESEMHQRFDIGTQSTGNYHSIDTGKYCMAPYFALRLGERMRPLGEAGA